MINTERIVPVTATDLLTLYGLILTMNSTYSGLTALAADNAVGDFSVTDGTNVLIANEPVKTIDIASDVSACTVVFVPSYDYEGFKINGAAVTPTGSVSADGRTLYKAVLASGAITITKLGF